MTPPTADNRTPSKTKKANPNKMASEPGARVKSGREDRQPRAGAPRVTVNDFQSDPMFPRVERAVAAILATGKVVTLLDVLIRMELLTRAKVEDWRFGRVAYLECNLTKLGRIFRILRMHAHDLKLVPSQTAYVRWGKRRQHVPLRFSKTSDPKVEQAYNRHFIWPRKEPFHKLLPGDSNSDLDQP